MKKHRLAWDFTWQGQISLQNHQNDVKKHFRNMLQLSHSHMPKRFYTKKPPCQRIVWLPATSAGKKNMEGIEMTLSMTLWPYLPKKWGLDNVVLDFNGCWGDQYHTGWLFYLLIFGRFSNLKIWSHFCIDISEQSHWQPCRKPRVCLLIHLGSNEVHISWLWFVCKEICGRKKLRI